MKKTNNESFRAFAGAVLPALLWYLIFFCLRYAVRLLNVPAGDASALVSGLMLPLLVSVYYARSMKEHRGISLAALGAYALLFLLLASHPGPMRIFAFGLAGPVAEEIVFRGWVYEKSRKAFGFRAALLLSSLLFAAGHAAFPQMLIAFAAGCILALAREKTGALGVPVLLHIGWNALQMALQPL